MASPSNKPRDIKNLKARLGRTITPGQSGAPGAFPAPGASVPPPTFGGGFPAPPLGGFPGASAPPGAVAPTSPGSVPGSVPGGLPGASLPPGTPGGSPFSAPPAVARPAQAQPAQQVAPAVQPAATHPGTASPQAVAAANPFGGAVAPVAAADRKVTLVIDDSAINSDELGQKSAMRSAMLVVFGLAIGTAAGWGIGGTTQEREQYNLALRDGKEIFAKVQEVSKTVETAQQTLKKAVDAAQAGPGKTPSVNHEAIQGLIGLERPFSANEFHRRRYRAFPAPVVDDLFDYYNNINLVWDRLTVLGAKTAGKNKQAALAKSAAATDGLIKSQYGAVISKTGEALTASLVYVTPGQEAPKKGEAPKLQIASSQGGKTVGRDLYVGQDNFDKDYARYVIVLDKMRSRSILGESASLFAQYQGQLMELKGLLSKVSETQGRLTKELGKVAAMEETGFF